MMNKKWFAAVACATLMALPGIAAAHAMDKDGGQHFKQCISSMCKGKDARFCSKTLSKAFSEDRVDFKRMHAAHEKLKRIMDARKFDGKSFLALTDRMAALHSAMVHRHAEAFAAVAARQSPEERKELMRKFFRMSMTMAHHDMMNGMMNSNKKEQHDWFSHLNK